MHKREENRKARVQTILAIASRLFLERGYAATTMSAIAAEMGGSKSTLWTYFATKEELFSAFIDARSASFWPDLVELLTPSLDDFGSVLHAFATRFIGRLVQPDAVQFHRLVAGESGRFPEVGRLFVQRMAYPLDALFVRFVQHYISGGALQTADAHAVSRTILNLCFGYTNRMLWGEPAPDDEVIASEAAHIRDIVLARYASIPGACED